MGWTFEYKTLPLQYLVWKFSLLKISNLWNRTMNAACSVSVSHPLRSWASGCRKRVTWHWNQVARSPQVFKLSGDFRYQRHRCYLLGTFLSFFWICELLDLICWLCISNEIHLWLLVSIQVWVSWLDLPWDANDSIEQIARDKVTKWAIQKKH